MKFSKINLASLKSFIVPTLILLTIGLIVPFAFIPLLDNVKETNNKLKADQERLGILSEKVNVLDSIDESDVNDKLSRSEQVLPVGKSLASLVVGIQNLAVGNKLTVVGITLSPGKVATDSATPAETANDQTGGPSSVGNRALDSQPKGNVLVLELNLNGSISSLQQFLAKLQNAKRLVFPNEVSLTSDEEEKNFVIKIFLEAPFRPVPKAQGDFVAEPLPELSEKDLETLEFVDRFTNVTNIKITEVKVGLKDPFSGK